jgi:hypothetical protein
MSQSNTDPEIPEASETPTPDTQVFNLADGEALKTKGMELAAESRKELLNIARIEARFLAMKHPEHLVTADEVQAALIAKNYNPAQLGNAAGSIFKGKAWQFQGYQKSARKSNHGRDIKIWKYLPENDLTPSKP